MGLMGLILLLDVGLMLLLVGLMLLDLVGQAQDSPRGLIVSIVRKQTTLKTLARLYMASLRIRSPNSPIKPIVIGPSL